MTYRKHALLMACVIAAAASSAARAQSPTFLVVNGAPSNSSSNTLSCSGTNGHAIDIAYEGLQATGAQFGASPGGGEGGQFDPRPLLSTKVKLAKGACLNAHFSATATYGPLYFNRAPMTLFQVTLTPAGGGNPRHMVGHYETPYGIASPAVPIQAESDAEMISANFFQKVGTGTHELPPGTYRVDLWWAGAPPPAPGVPTGAIGADFVLKLYW